MNKLLFLPVIFFLFGVSGCSTNESSHEADAASADSLRSDVDDFLSEYNRQYQDLYYQAAQAEWRLNTYIKEGDSTANEAATRANESLAAFTGSNENINKVRGFLEKEDMLHELQVKQLEKILYFAGNNPEPMEEIVKKKIAAETAQTEKLFGFQFFFQGKEVSTNYLDSVLDASENMDHRLEAWISSKEVGKPLKGGLENLQHLRNETVRALGYQDYFSYQVSDYGMTTEEMLELNRKFVRELWPLYRELHTYARYELANQYGEEVPEMLPAQWLPNRWSQDWSSMIEVEGYNLDSVLATKSADWIIKKGEQFYVSMGFPKLPESFFEKSSLYPLPPDAGYKKNNHASAWHLDLDKDVRSLMSVIPNASWFETVNHELGHIYYYMTYTNKDVPLVLREGANRAFHEAIGTQIGMAAMMRSFLEEQNLLSPSGTGNEERQKEQEMQTLLKQAMNYVVFIPWSAGVMTEFEYDLYANELPVDQFNQRWWELKEKYQGITTPLPRGEEYCDACSKTHINNDAAQYYDYAISSILLFQLHDHISGNILSDDPRNANYFGNLETGEFLKDLMYPGASADWRTLLKDATGEDLSARAMLSYFDPLLAYLKEKNNGRTYTLPETI
ncbi:MAG: M2 family metallopeptidase [Bacteroidia bacterium]